MIGKIVLEIWLYFLVAVLLFVAWALFPFVVLRFALVVVYVVFIRWAWKRGA